MFNLNSVFINLLNLKFVNLFDYLIIIIIKYNFNKKL